MPYFPPPASGGGSSFFPGFDGYISGYWFRPFLEGQLGASSATPATTSTYLMPFGVLADVTIQALGIYVTTAGTNVRLAIYANNPATGRPTGLPLAKTADIVATSAGGLSGALLNSAGSSLPSLALSAGDMYWLAAQADNTALRWQSLLAGTSHVASLIGSATIADLCGAAAIGAMGYQVNSGTYGTFADLTSATFVFDASHRAPTPLLQVA